MSLSGGLSARISVAFVLSSPLPPDSEIHWLLFPVAVWIMTAGMYLFFELTFTILLRGIAASSMRLTGKNTPRKRISRKRNA
jgi:hypothetical protein